MMRSLFLALCLFPAFGLFAQDSAAVRRAPSDGSIELFSPSAQKKPEKAKPNGIVYTKEFSVGGKITTTGWGFFGEYSRAISSTKKRVWSLEFMELKHPKQIKQSNEFVFPAFGLESPKAYVYGKQNNLYVVHAGYGGRFQLGDKARKSGVEVGMSWSAGPTLGLLKPYYLKVIETNGDFFTIQDERYNDAEPDKFLNKAGIYGASGFSYGLGQMGFVAGAHGKIGLNFDWANYSEVVKSLEAGVGADLFAGRPEIMIVERNKFQFVYLYLSLQLGKRW